MTLTPTRRRILVAGLILFALAGAFPPWKLAYPPNRSRPAGLHFLLAPPAPWGLWQPRVDVMRLVIIWLVIVSGTAVALILPPRRDRAPARAVPDAPPAFPAPGKPPDALPGARRPWA